MLILTLGVAAGLPLLVKDNEKLALTVSVVVVAAGVAARWPWLLPVIAVPGILLAEQRIGGRGGGLALGDVLLIAAAGLAIPALRGQPRTLARPVMLVFAVYLALLLPSLAYHHDRVALTEVVHRLAVVVGGLSVGLLLYRIDQLKLALRLLFAAASMVAVVAIVDALTSGLAPAYPLGLNKNFAGPIMGRSAALLIIAPAVVDLPARVRGGLIMLLGVGVAATQSRNAVIALTIAAIIWVVRSGGLRRASGSAVLLIVLVLGAFAAYTLVTEFQASQNGPDVHNSYTERVRVEQQTRDLWRTSPVVGVGLRFFNTPEYAGYQAPNNVFDEILAEAGDFGAVGMSILIIGTCGVLSRGKGPLATAGFALVLTSFISGQFDIFWVNGQALPWIIAGAGAAADERQTSQPRPIRVAA